MSNALAIAHVTQALALQIENNLRPEIDMAVSVETRKPPAEPPTEPTINVFLYQVTPNTSRRNDDLVTRASDGTLVKRAAAALDLHYVISAYGEETELVGQRLIGSVVRTLHEIPVLPKDVIEAAGERPWLAGSDLTAAEQRVRFTPQVMDIDETSKLWGMLHQTPYALSVVYMGTLVLIDGRERPVPAPPVRERTVRVLPFGAPGAPVPPVIGEYPLPSEGEGAADGEGAGAVPSARGASAPRAASGAEKKAAGATDAKGAAVSASAVSASAVSGSPQGSSRTAKTATSGRSAARSTVKATTKAATKKAANSSTAKQAARKQTAGGQAAAKQTPPKQTPAQPSAAPKDGGAGTEGGEK